MAQTVSCQPSTREAWVQHHAIPVGFVWTEWQWDRFISKFCSLSLSATFHQCSILIHLSTPLQNLSKWHHLYITYWTKGSYKAVLNKSW